MALFKEFYKKKQTESTNDGQIRILDSKGIWPRLKMFNEILD